MDGRSYLFYGGAAQLEAVQTGAQQRLTVFETGIALTLVQFLALAGALYDAGQLHGYVDVGMAVTGIQGGISSHLLGQPFASVSAREYQDEGAYRTLRCDSRELVDDPQDIVRRLTGRLMRALYGSDLDPLAND